MRILIIEDDELVGPMLARQLRRRGHECVLVTTINSVREFLAKIDDSGFMPECVLTDRDLLYPWLEWLIEVFDCPVRYMSGREGGTREFWHKGVEPLEKLYQLIEKT